MHIHKLPIYLLQNKIILRELQSTTSDDAPVGDDDGDSNDCDNLIDENSDDDNYCNHHHADAAGADGDDADADDANDDVAATANEEAN